MVMAMAATAAAREAEGKKEDRAAQVASHQTRFQKIVLGWDYPRLLARSKINHKKQKGADQYKLHKVPDSFADLNEYLKVFESLLLEECRAQILRGDDDGETHCHMVAVTQWERVNEFYFARLAIDTQASQEFTENDLVLLSKEKVLEGALPTTYAFASVESCEGQKTLRVRMYLDREGQKDGTSARGFKSVMQVLTALQGPSSAWWLLKLCNLSTIMREYTSLHSVGVLPFVNVILSGTYSATNETGSVPAQGWWNIPQPLLEYLKLSHNDSQLQAIQAGLSHNPLVLIQGPPGTGKTQTILGLLSVVLHSTPIKQPLMNGEVMFEQKPEISYSEKKQHWIKASPWIGQSVNPRDLNMPVDGDDGFFPTSGSQFRPETLGTKRKHRAHVLVCAPSNSALDEIVLRLLHTGLRDENGLMYTPSIVRVGLNAHHSVQSVTMDNLVAQRMSSMERSAVSAGPRASAGMERDRMRIAILDEASIVGDPLQLPATVLSTEAVAYGYGKSLFRRFQKAGYPVNLLNTQYRMHPEIREFPSREFYESALEDGAEVHTLTKRPWHEHRCFGPFAFFDVDGTETQPAGSGSWVNKDEAEFVLVLYRHMVATYPELKSGPLVAVISPYKLQVKLLRQRFTEVLGKESARLVDINTVDGFQGREKDVAIFSCVRASQGKGIGFVSDFRRMNVGLTRARTSMLVVGCADALKIDKHWSNLVASSQQRRRYFKVKKPYYALFTDSSLEEMKKMEDEFEMNLTRTGIPGVAKIARIQQVPMDVEIPDEEEVVEAYDNHGDVDEDVEDV
ncbi:hypothetical protein BDL97_02G009000 [Sphagnum fallax]|nr:hypothetical protein BDL97_02G009000 [Sphagnum fallax]